MSLIVSNKKLKKDHVLIGKTPSNNIYFKAKVPKEERVRELEMEEDIIPIPYLPSEGLHRIACFISGISGAGKSTKAVELIKTIRGMRGQIKNKETKEMEQKKVVVFTATNNIDPAFEGLDNFAWVNVYHAEFPLIKVEMLENNILVFDDWTSITDKRLAKYVQAMIIDILETARKKKIDIICITHMTQNFNQTRGIIFESNFYLLNLNTNLNSSLKFLKSYMDVDKKQLTEFKELGSNSLHSWTFVSKTFPMYYIHENRIKLL